MPPAARPELLRADLKGWLFKLTKRVSIDGYSTYRAARFSEPVGGAKSGVFFMPQRTACFLPQGQRGGCGIKKRGGVAAPHSLNSFVFCGLPLLFGFHNDDTEKSGKTIATPPKRGVPTGPDSGPSGQSSIRPQGVAIVGIYPCGKAWNSPPEGR